MLSLPVSLGEALDKYSILLIKKKKLEGNKEVEKELEAITPLIPFPETPTWLKLLEDVNLQIWDWCEKVRDPKNPDYAALCQKIIEFNDYRFIIKNKINLTSNLKEQKSYPKKKALVLSHLGMGDQITLNAAVRWLSSRYDEILVAGKRRHRDALEFMYRDDPSIGFVFINENMDLAPSMSRFRKAARFLRKMKELFPYEIENLIGDKQYIIFKDITEKAFHEVGKSVGYEFNTGFTYRDGILAIELDDSPEPERTQILHSGNNYIVIDNCFDDPLYDYFPSQGYKMILSGCNLTGGFDFPKPFFEQIYSDMGLDWGIRYSHFYVRRNLAWEKECQRKNGLEGIKYTFLHSDRNTGGKLMPDIPLETGKRYYHPNESLGFTPWEGEYYNIFDYCTIMEEAEEIIVKDSCFFCLATNLNLSKVKKLVVYTRIGDPVDRYLKGSPSEGKWEIVPEK